MTLEDNFLLHYLKKFDRVPFDITIHGKRHHIGEGDARFSVQLNGDIKKEDLLNSTSLALGEAYMKEKLIIEGDLYEALSDFLSQIGGFTASSHMLKMLRHAHTKQKEKNDVSSHYDIGNDFYKMWLDQSMSYSCGYFKNSKDTLYQAQVQKVEYILEKLYLKEGMTLLDIGCGWGFLLLHAAKQYKVKGCGITLSEEQFKEFSKRIEEEHLEEYLTVKMLDYHDLPKLKEQFDRIVSVGMLEHVGRENYELFMDIIKKILKPKGLFLLHYISGQLEQEGDPWIRKYIFPGGQIPSLREIVNLCPKEDFHILDVQNLRPHYCETLLRWNANFQKCKGEVIKKYGEEFARMWELYLCSCAAGFRNGVVSLHQILMSNGVNNELPMTRWY